jgi:hypothetical protein
MSAMQSGRNAQQVQANGVIPELCEQRGCASAIETWCVLCERYFCARHDELYPVRRHDCLRGKAEVA